MKKKATWEEAQRLRGMPFDWIQIDSGSERHYPNGPLAAHILGGVDFEEKGNSGIEKALEAELEGAPGEERMLTDVKGRGIDALVESEPKPGAALTLTIDERLQFVAERELAAAAEAKGAHSGSVVVMNPHNGEILALASYPAYDPNLPPDGTEDPEARLNHASSVPFEPGSVFKVITLSAALETTHLRPESMINCGRGAITLFGRTIHEAHGGYGVISMADVLEHSSNMGAIQIGMTVGQANMHEYVRRFGFGRKNRDTAAGGIARTAAQAGAVEQGLAAFDLDRAGSQRDHAATGAGGRGGGQRRHAGEAAAGAEEGRPGCAGGSAGAGDQARDGDHHAADDGRRGDAGRDGVPGGAAGRILGGGENRVGADLRRGGQALHALLQRFVHGFRAAH